MKKLLFLIFSRAVNAFSLDGKGTLKKIDVADVAKLDTQPYFHIREDNDAVASGATRTLSLKDFRGFEENAKERGSI